MILYHRKLSNFLSKFCVARQNISSQHLPKLIKPHEKPSNITKPYQTHHTSYKSSNIIQHQQKSSNIIKHQQGIIKHQTSTRVEINKHQISCKFDQNLYTVPCHGRLWSSWWVASRCPRSARHMRPHGSNIRGFTGFIWRFQWWENIVGILWEYNGIMEA